VVSDYRDALASPRFVLDDYQTGPALDIASSGGAVRGDVLDRYEGQLDDANYDFDHDPTDPMNGMTRCTPSDTARGTVFTWDATAPRSLEVDVPAGERDFSDDVYLTLRACQSTRHPETTAELAGLTFTVVLADAGGVESRVGIGAYGNGIEEPYQRVGCGFSGAGWQNELEVVRIRLTDFLANGSGLDLTRIRTLRLELGGAAGSAQGRLGLDDLALSKD
jgi:hypothetical protein